MQYKNGKYNYFEILIEKYKKCLLYVSPYEYCTKLCTLCILFSFRRKTIKTFILIHTFPKNKNAFR
jgi:hypothetical protein